MKNYKEKFIIDIQEYGVDKKDKEILLDTFEDLMIKTSSLVKKVEFDIDEFAWAGKYAKGYTLRMERIFKEDKLEQWKAIFIKNNKELMVVLGQVEG